MFKKIKYLLVDTAGQVTAVVVTKVPRLKQSDVSKMILKKNKTTEQVLFIERYPNKYRLQMMGNELSINGSLAGLFVLEKAYNIKKIKVEISGLDLPIKATICNNTTEAYFPLSIFKQYKSKTVSLAGISYLLIPLNRSVPEFIQKSKLLLKVKAKTLTIPAMGIIFFKKGYIKPLVYVKDTNSFIWESACGSGSLSYYIYSGISKIKQPSNKFIEVKRKNNYFSVKCATSILK